MPSRHSHFITDAPWGIGTVRQVYGDGGGPEARLVRWGRTQAKSKFPKPYPLTAQGPPRGEEDIRLEERDKERARIAHELHDTLLQGFLGATMLLHQAVQQTPADSPSKPALSRALQLVGHAIDEGRAAILGLRTSSPAMSGLEQAFANLLEAVTPPRGVRGRVLVQGKPRTLNPAIQEQVFLIGREAVMNALRHSDAKSIEVDIQYLRDILRMFVRDNGCGITPDAVQQAGESHWGLRGMRDRAAGIDARFGIWSSPGAGTELRVVVPLVARTRIHDNGPNKGRSESTDGQPTRQYAASRDF